MARGAFALAGLVAVLIVAAIWYLVVVTILSLIQGRIEKYFSKGVAAAGNTK